MHLVLLSGGLGGARLAPALVRALGRRGRLTVVANVGDDHDWMGLPVSPDVDSVLYALAGLHDGARGFGRRDETFACRDTLAALGAPAWFGVGDRDLALHLGRAEALRTGATPTAFARRAARALGADAADLLPASDERARTIVATADGRRLRFQEWYVRERAEPEVADCFLARAPAAPEAIRALRTADALVLGPSNPVSSLGAILALDGMREACRTPRRRIAVSPVVGDALASPDAGVRHHALARARLLAPLGRSDTPGSIAALHAGLAEAFVFDERDEAERGAIAALGLAPVAADLLDPAALAAALLAAAAA